MPVVHANAESQQLLADLTEAQREAVSHTDGPLLVLAGPGSGKTRVITRRAAYLARTVTKPWHVLAITFTNKAAAEMRERIAALGHVDGMAVSTFHAWCAKTLRIHHDRAGIARHFTILDRDDRRKTLKRVIEECDLDSKQWTAARVERHISNAKNALESPEEFAQTHDDWYSQTLARIYAQYEKQLAKTDCLDFDDLLMRVAMLLTNDTQLREQLEDRHRYVLIDEYQDTNAAQYRIAKVLTQSMQNLCATGDPDQSIYGWRGADIGNILSFERDYPTAHVVRLEQNFRSTQRILAAADGLIAGNIQRKEKTLWTTNDQGDKIVIAESEDGVEEAAQIARAIDRHLAAGTPRREMAVFYRTNSLSRTVEEVFLQHGIPYQIARGLEFYNRKEIKDVLAYLRVLVNPADEVSLLRIINTPARGIGATTIKRIIEVARERGVSLLDMIRSDGLPDLLGRSAAKVRSFANLLTQLNAFVALSPKESLERVIAHSGLRAHYYNNDDPDDSPSRNLDELISAAAAFEDDVPEATLIDWLEHAALIGDVDSIDEAKDRVTLMTLHAAKGLEFDVVFVLGLEEGLLPLRREQDDDSNDEEERRLCFVGMTRARKHLQLSYARYRMLRGNTQRTIRSPFLDELPVDAVQLPEQKKPARKARRFNGPQEDNGSLPADIAQWQMGTLVRHERYGLGRIMKIDRGAKRTHVNVLFQSGKRQSWMLEFAPLTRVEFDEVD